MVLKYRSFLFASIPVLALHLSCSYSALTFNPEGDEGKPAAAKPAKQIERRDEHDTTATCAATSNPNTKVSTPSYLSLSVDMGRGQIKTVTIDNPEIRHWIMSIEDYGEGKHGYHQDLSKAARLSQQFADSLPYDLSDPIRTWAVDRIIQYTNERY